MLSEVVLCDDHVHDCPYLLNNVRRLEAEVERLRAALDQIWQGVDLKSKYPDGRPYELDREDMRQRAKRTLHEIAGGDDAEL